MKKFTLILIATILLCFSCEKLMAQAPYKASVGGIHAVSGIGPSVKAFITDHVTIQTDFLFIASFPICKEKNDTYFAMIVLIEQNTNIMYQKKIKNKSKSELFWFIGGGVTFGYHAFVWNAKFGVNTISGFECVFKKIPFAIQFDIRPGYGILFNSGKTLNYGIFRPNINPSSYFDWLIGLSFRYTLNNKIVE